MLKEGGAQDLPWRGLNEPDCPQFINCHANMKGDNATLLVALLQPQVCCVCRLDPNGRCESENIKVFDGSSTDGPLLGKVCSKNDFVPVFESSSNSLTFQIVTDRTNIQRSVFIFYYFFSPGTCKLSLVHPFHRPQQAQVTQFLLGTVCSWFCSPRRKAILQYCV